MTIWDELKRYISKTRHVLVVVMAIVFFTHGSLLFSQRIGIDTEIMMDGRSSFGVLGRQGLIWLGKLLGLEWFNLWYVQILTLIFMMLAPLAYGFLFYYVGKQKRYENIALVLFGLGYIVSPIWASQLYFLNQSAQLTCACVLVAICVLFAEYAREKLNQRWIWLLIALGMMQTVFACYQTIILMYISTIVTIFLISSIENERTLKEQLQWILYHVVTFVVGFALYGIISKVFYLKRADYLDNQIWWHTTDFKQCIINTINAIRGMFGDHLPYYTGLYRFLALILVVLTIFYITRMKKAEMGSKILFLVAEIFLIGAPSLLIMYAGGPVADRTQFIIPLCQACILYLIIYLLSKKQIDGKKYDKWINRFVCVALAVIVFRDVTVQANYCSRLYYTDEWVSQYDRTVAQDVYARIQTVIQNSDESTVENATGLFLGELDVPYDATCISGEIIGVSRFQYNANELSRHRIVYLMKQLGYPIQEYFTYYSDGANAAFNAYFREYFGEEVDAMPSYPAYGCVKIVSNDEIGLSYLVVKLSDNWWVWGE